jgi:glucosyl-3-phosphoglycerate phosphatase
VTRLVLLRHGRTAWNHEGRAQGHADIPLDAEGEAQAKAAAGAVAAYEPHALWSSDLARARQTAECVAAETGLVPVLDPRLREFDVGPNRMGLTRSEYAVAHPDEHAALTAGEVAAIPGRETDEDVVRRFLPALASYVDELGEGRTGVVVTHGAAMRVCVAAFLGWPVEVVASLGGIANCGWVELDRSVSTWEGGEPRWRLRAWNRVAG